MMFDMLQMIKVFSFMRFTSLEHSASFYMLKFLTARDCFTDWWSKYQATTEIEE